MGIELGSAIGNIAGSLGKAGAGVTEGARAAPVSGLARIGGLALGAVPSGEIFGGTRVLGGLGGFKPLTLSVFPDLGGTARPPGELKAAVPVNRFGVRLTAPAEPIVNEGPAGKSFLENTMPITKVNVFRNGEIKFTNPIQRVVVPEPIKIWEYQAKHIKEVKPEGRLPSWEVIVPSTEPAVSPVRVTNGQIMQRSLNVLGYAKPAQTVAVQPAIKIQEEQEEAVTEKLVKEEPKEVLEEEEITDKRVFIEDGEASSQRKQEIKEAVVKAKAEAERSGLEKITGWLVAKLLPAEHEGNRSQVVKKTGPDGSYQETVEEIAGAGDLESEEQAVKRFNAIVAEKKPVKQGKEGTPVADKDVARVFRYRLIKLVQAYEEVIRRVVKKTNADLKLSADSGLSGSYPVETTSVVSTHQRWTGDGHGEVRSGTGLEDLGLAGVFQKSGSLTA